MKNKYPLSRIEALVVQEVDNEVLIYDLNNNKAFCLNQTSAMIWQLCDGTKSLTDISKEVSKNFKSPADEGLVWLAVEQLKKEKLVESETAAPIGLEELSRRDAIRKVGLASLIALPVIMSLQSPVAAAAASVCGTMLGGTCHCLAGAGVCPGFNMVVAPNQTPCPGAALSPEGQAGLIVCNSISAGCMCVGPFTCVNSGSGTNTHKEGMCG